VVLLDLMMPGMSGREVLRRLRARPDLRTIPVIVVTAGELSEQGVTAELQTITRRDGLTSGQFVRCLRGALDGLLAPSDTAQA